MNDAPDTKKGIRTFAADYARLKKTSSTKNNKGDAQKNDTDSKDKHTDTIIPKEPVVADSHTEDIKQIVAEKAKPEQTIATKESLEPKKIPSFHELQKTVDHIDASSDNDTTKEQPKRKKGITAKRKVGGGTVITDTKKVGRPKHLSLLAGVTQWFKSLTKKKKRSPRMAIPETNRRKGVIQEAATKTGTIFTADSETLKGRIKARARQQAAEADDPETNWSPYTEVGYPLLETGDEIQQTPVNVNVAFKQHTNPEPKVAAAPVIAPNAAEEVNPLSQPTKEPTVAKESIVEKADSPDVPNDADVGEDNRWEKTTIDDSTTTPEPVVLQSPQVAAPEPEPKKIASEVQTSTSKPALGNPTNRLAVIITAAIVTLVVITFVGVQVYSYFQTPQTTTEITTSVLVGDRAINLTIDQSFTAQSLLNSARSGESGAIEYTLYNTDAEALPAALALGLVTDGFPVTIQQFGTKVSFISIDQSRPQLLLRVTDQVSVTGALLAHETALADSVTPLFGATTAGTFMDTTIDTSDVRVLTTTAGERSLTYGFINDTTLLIAGSVEEFEAVLSRTK